MTRMFGLDENFGEDAILGRLEGMKEVIEKVNKQFKDPVSLDDWMNHLCVQVWNDDHLIRFYSL